MCAVKESEMYNSTLLFYILMNTVKNYPTIHLRLNWIDMLEVVILLMTYLIKYVFQIKLSVFNMIKGINESKTLTKQIKNGTMINVDVSVKNIIYVKKITCGIVLHIVAKVVNI